MSTGNRIQDVWGERTPYERSWPERIDERTVAEPDQWIQSACVLCSNGCGLDLNFAFLADVVLAVHY